MFVNVWREMQVDLSYLISKCTAISNIVQLEKM